jgi:hypothetical protein
MKTLDAKLRASAEEASAVITNIFVRLPPGAMNSFLNFLYDSLKYLSSPTYNYADRWGITLFKDGIRLNAGWARILGLHQDGLNVLVKNAPKGTRFFNEVFRTAPGCKTARVPLSDLPHTLPSLSKAHHDAIAVAAKHKTTKYIRGAHSVGVTRFLSESLHQPAIDPSYLPLSQDYRDAAVQAAELQRSNSQGFQSDVEVRRAVEEHAMKRAKSYFAKLGYAIIPKGKPYDLHCTKGASVLYVEVKGTQTDGRDILLTPGEVRFANEHQGKMALFVLHSIAVSREGGEIVTNGGLSRIETNWIIEMPRLSALEYSYELPEEQSAAAGTK